MFWNEPAECMPQEERRQLQNERLQQTVRRCYEQVPAYRKKLDDAGIRPADIRSIAAMFAPTTDPDADYRVLEVSPNATDEEIRKAYRRMSMKHHPDKVAHLGPEFQKTATAKFQRVSAAYANIKKSRGMN